MVLILNELTCCTRCSWKQQYFSYWTMLINLDLWFSHQFRIVALDQPMIVVRYWRPYYTEFKPSNFSRSYFWLVEQGECWRRPNLYCDLTLMSPCCRSSLSFSVLKSVYFWSPNLHHNSVSLPVEEMIVLAPLRFNLAHYLEWLQINYQLSYGSMNYFYSVYGLSLPDYYLVLYYNLWAYLINSGR